MRKVKTAKFIAVALAAFSMMTSCTNENEIDNNLNTTKTNLSVKVAGVVKTRAVETPGSSGAGTIQLEDGYIFVVNPLDVVTYREALVVGDATSPAGQILRSQVPTNSRVYIVGNCGTSGAIYDALSTKTTLADVKAVAVGIETQTDYTRAALANNGDAVQIVLNDDAATVAVALQPIISRLELAQVKAAAPDADENEITAFTVEGIYVDNYYSKFTFGGDISEVIYAQSTSTDFSSMLDVMKDEGIWAADANLISIPSAGKLWAYQVASNGVPRLIIKLTGVKYIANGVEVDRSTETFYLTVKRYLNVTGFERGKIYRIGGANGITFGPGDLAVTPNPVDVDLTVKVTIVEWEIVDSDTELM